MLATLHARPPTPVSKVLKRVRLEHVYPLFGFRRQVVHMPLPLRMADIQAWLLRQDRSQPHESWSARWERCQQECPSCFKIVWIVRLPRRSRSLQAGDYVFEPLTDFLHIPGSPPPVVEDCYQAAFAELPHHRFVYLDLVWDMTPSGLQLVSVEKLQRRMLEQEQQLKKRLRMDRLLIEAARARLRDMQARLSGRERTVRRLPAINTPAEARRLLELSDEALQRTIAPSAGSLEWIKYDPVIVFEEPGLLERAGGHMPLGLIAHWD